MRRFSKGLLAGGAAVLVLCLSAAVALAQNARMMNHRPGPMAQREMMFGPGAFLRGLNLTQPQKDQVKTIFANHKTEIQRTVNEMADARMALNDDVFNGADQKVLQGDLSKVGTAEADAVALRSSIWAEIKPILTQDQLTQLQTQRQSMDQRMQNRLNRSGKKTSGY